MSGIYIHIPFCKQACNYCDFHFSTSLKNKDDLVLAIVKEIELRKNYLPNKSINTIYFGGGTPSILQEKDLFLILNAIYKLYTINNDIELTLECNPDDLTDDKLKELKRLEVNRLSIGLQSFNDEELIWMNRAHSASESESSVKRAQDKGFDNLTIDLIYGSKFSNLKNWKSTLQKAIDLKVNHISSYNLTAEPKTKLGHDVSKLIELPIDDELSADLFLEMINLLRKNNFQHYEISNFAKEGFISKHNSNYWKGEYYLGLGPSAHSFDGTSRQWNVANNNLYLKKIQTNDFTFFEKEILTEAEKFNEYILTSLRTAWGINKLTLAQKFKHYITSDFDDKITQLLKKELVIINNTSIVLSEKGKLIADKIASDLFIA